MVKVEKTTKAVSVEVLNLSSALKQVTVYDPETYTVKVADSAYMANLPEELQPEQVKLCHKYNTTYVAAVAQVGAEYAETKFTENKGIDRLYVSSLMYGGNKVEAVIDREKKVPIDNNEALEMVTVYGHMTLKVIQDHGEDAVSVIEALSSISTRNWGAE